MTISRIGGGSTPAPVGDPVDSSLDNVLSNGTAQEAQTDQILVRLVNELAAQQFEERAAEYERTLSQHTGMALRTPNGDVPPTW